MEVVPNVWSLGNVLTILIVVYDVTRNTQLCCRCRRGLIDKVAAEERRREEAEDELRYQVQRQETLQQTAPSAPPGDVYEQINLEEQGYAIPSFIQPTQSGRSGYEQLPERAPTPPAPRSPATSSGDSEPVETEPRYSRSLPPIDNT